MRGGLPRRVGARFPVGELALSEAGASRSTDSKGERGAFPPDEEQGASRRNCTRRNRGKADAPAVLEVVIRQESATRVAKAIVSWRYRPVADQFDGSSVRAVELKQSMHPLGEPGA